MVREDATIRECGLFSTLLSVLAFVFVSISVSPSVASAQGINDPLPNFNGGNGLAASGDETAKRLTDEKQNTYRVDPSNGQGGVSSHQEVRENMKNFFEKIYVEPGSSGKSEIDKWFSPHLRDITVADEVKKEQVIGPAGRALAGIQWHGLWCYGACPICSWPHPEHMTGTCCASNTMAYAPLIEDTNFKACCVRKEEASLSMEEIACRHPLGDGWAGLFEYYYPTVAIGWEAQRLTTMIATRDEVKECVDGSDALMENSEWVKLAIEKNLETVQGKADASLEGKIRDGISDVRPQGNEKKNRFSDSLQGGGLTMRVNLAHMDPEERRAIAEEFCMHPDQLMKLMDPREDKNQMPGTGGPNLPDLERIKPWANYCPNAVQLMTDPRETFKVVNTDGTPTNFQAGMSAFEQDPLYCQKMNVQVNDTGGKFLKEGVFKKSGFTARTEESVGYTCRTGDPQKGGFQTRMVPVELHSTAKIDPRTLDHAIPFMIAGGYYQGGMSDENRSIYKRFEPMPYSDKFDVFRGKKFEGDGPREPILTAQGARPSAVFCRGVNGKNYQGSNQPDQLFLSDKNHPPFTKDPIQKFNHYDREWAESDPQNFHNRNFDKSVLNYGAAFRIFATCPAGYERWRGPDSEKFTQACGEEHFGARK